MPLGFVWRAENELFKKNKIEAYGQNFFKKTYDNLYFYLFYSGLQGDQASQS